MNLLVSSPAHLMSDQPAQTGEMPLHSVTLDVPLTHSLLWGKSTFLKSSVKYSLLIGSFSPWLYFDTLSEVSTESYILKMMDYKLPGSEFTCSQGTKRMWER